MFVGFDYGTANCSMAFLKDGKPELIAIEQDNTFIPSTLCAPTREAVTEYLYRFWDIKSSTPAGEQLLRQAMSFNRMEDIEVEKNSLLFGQEALDFYIDDPEEVYYVKSPKSFLGATGLRDVQIALFEDLVCAMMVNIKQKAELSVEQEITKAVIGRPVNFQGSKGEEANQQAINILTSAAKRSGFKDIEFQLEPVAAGLDFEQTLTQDKTVLVVDIGGGTTDCSMIQMGPSWLNKNERNGGILAHSGRRVGGNDLDIYLAYQKLMPLLGSGSKNLKGRDLPMGQFWNPIAINNVVAQSEFFASKNRDVLIQLMRDAQEPQKLARLIKLYDEKLSYRVIRDAEKTKIALSEQQSHDVDLSYLESGLDLSISSANFEEAIINPQQKINELVSEAIVQAGKKPDIIYVTGGSARSPILRAALKTQLPGIEIVGGNYFGSVTSGLAYWAEHCFS